MPHAALSLRSTSSTPTAQADLAAALQQLLSEAGVGSAAELLPDPGPTTPHPRTARVNTLKMSVEQALQWLRQPPPEHRRKWEAVVSEAWGRCADGLAERAAG